MFENKYSSKTDIGELGEFGLIEHLTNQFKIKQNNTIVGIGDDAAILDLKKGHTVITTDLLVENVHFDLSYMPLKHLGYKAMMVNLSDVYAMNAMATHVTVSIAVSNRFGVEALEELYSGIYTAADIYGIDVIGGDTTSSETGLLISITAIGSAKPETIVRRSGAKPNNILVVTGDLGAAYMGLQVLRREKEVFKVNPNSQPDLSQYTYLIERQLKPEARRDVITILKELDVQPTSMIDISDGLSSETMHLCKSSKVGAMLYESRFPLDPQVISTCEEFNLDSTTVALNGGEDYELLFTIDQKDYGKVKDNPNFTIIGHISEAEKGMYLRTRGDENIPLKARGWNPLKNS